MFLRSLIKLGVKKKEQLQPRSGLNIFVISVQPTTGLYF